ncbi:hypothetical protein LNQ52_30585 [Klebsiella pneumoniae subsp. pneumoniae]|nr:hypothetical protein [Klebsiella pneumoniae subsp. pneumoniae]
MHPLKVDPDASVVGQRAGLGGAASGEDHACAMNSPADGHKISPSAVGSYRLSGGSPLSIMQRSAKRAMISANTRMEHRHRKDPTGR